MLHSRHKAENDDNLGVMEISTPEKTLNFLGQSSRGEEIVSDVVRKAIATVDVKVAVSVLREGAYLLKYCNNIFRKPHQRLFWVDMETLTLKWSSPKKVSSRTVIFLTDVHRIVPGVDSDFWRSKSELERRLGIELLSHSRELRIMCSSVEEWKIWLKGLLHAHQKAMVKRKRASSLTNDFIRKQWALADLDNNDSMSFFELVHLLQRINCRADVRYAEQLFEQFDEDGSCVLEFDEFKSLFHKLLTHEDLMFYFDYYRDKKLYTVTEEGFRKFLVEVQNTPAHLIPEQVNHIGPLEEPFKNDKGLTDLGFNLLLTSEFNSLMNPTKKKVSVADMKHPLTHYWISTSHNTYLTGDQMIGKSAVGQYIDVLLKGCRCVELDCWDGSDGEPVIYHGHTFTSKILFAAVVKACRDYGFQKSTFPIILSIEMHCSKKQKKRVGELLVEILGNQIYRHPVGSPVPTPFDLQYKFIIKGKVPKTGLDEEMEEGNENDIALNEEELKLELLSEYPESFFKEIRTTKITSPIVIDENYSSMNSLELGKTTKVSKADARNKKEDLLVYYQTISLIGNRLDSFESARNNMDICSINEKRFLKFAKSKSKEFSIFQQQHISRIYPSGTRLMSSNLNPVQCWLYGCQMVALNFQALGLATLLNLGRFMENGNSGYVLKPPILRNTQNTFDPLNVTPEYLRTVQEPPLELTIQILAAQQLPRPIVEERTNRKRDSLCPFVVVSLHGVKSDTVIKKTGFVLNNGLNPRWKDQKFTFNISVPSLAILAIEVHHYDTVRSFFLAGAALPVSSIRSGIRWVELYDSKLRAIHWSGLLVHVSIKISKPVTTAIDVAKLVEPLKKRFPENQISKI